MKPEIDKVLQDCDYGQRSFSLIEPDRYSKIHANLVEKVGDLLEKYRLNGLDEFLRYFSSQKQKSYIPQSVSGNQLRAVADYILQVDADLFKRLGRAIRNGCCVDLPNNEFYSIFDAGFDPERAPHDLQSFDMLAKRLLGGNIKKEAEVCREIALHFERLGRIELALEFMDVARVYRPKGPVINKHISKYVEMLKEV